jgi:hypothetical protein
MKRVVVEPKPSCALLRAFGVAVDPLRHAPRDKRFHGDVADAVRTGSP